MKLKHIGSILTLWLGLSVFAHAAAGLNDAFGIDLWSGPSLWQDNAPSTAKRLKIDGNEVGTNAHYKGPLDEKEKVLGVRAYSVEIYAAGDKISEVSIGFVNRADLYNELARKQFEANKGPNKSPVRNNRKEEEPKAEDLNMPALYIELEKRMEAEKDSGFKEVVNKLTQRIGKPNDGDEADIKKWVWSGHRLVVEKSASSLTLKIDPVLAAESAANVPASQKVQQVMTKTVSSVTRRGNGDVVIGGIPPISQGDRGFCVPATWEKVLRYYGLNLDVYQLADKGGTDISGSKFIPFAAKMSTMLEKQNYAVQFLAPGAPDLMKVREYVDKGIPLIWGMDAVDLRDWVDRSDHRKSSLPQVKSKVVDPSKANEKQAPAGHCLMVIGYNAGFQELALSDSTDLGSGRKEIWISLADAVKADMGQGLVAVVPKVTGAGTVAAGSPSTGGSAAPTFAPPPGGKKWY